MITRGGLLHWLIIVAQALILGVSAGAAAYQKVPNMGASIAAGIVAAASVVAAHFAPSPAPGGKS